VSNIVDLRVPLERYERSKRRRMPNVVDQGVLPKAEGRGYV
jgi:hypothetical protein